MNKVTRRIHSVLQELNRIQNERALIVIGLLFVVLVVVQIKTCNPGVQSPTSSVIPGYQLPVVDAIARKADELSLPPIAVLAMASQEGGLSCYPELGYNVCPIGDTNLDPRGSCGAFQIYIRVHGGTCEHWNNPVNAMNLMAPRWVNAFSNAGGWEAYLSNPFLFLRAWVPAAQGSIAWDDATARGAYRVAITAYIDCLQNGMCGARRTTGDTPDPKIAPTVGGLSDRIREVEELLLRLHVMRDALK